MAEDEFELGERLGGGASGEVVRAVWRPRGRVVALKALRRGVEPGSPEHARFLREAVVARVRSPCIVQVFEAGVLLPLPVWTSPRPVGAVRPLLRRFEVVARPGRAGARRAR